MEPRKYALPSRPGEVLVVPEKLEGNCRAAFGKPYVKFPHLNPVIEVADEALIKHIESLKAFDRGQIQRIPTEAEQRQAALEAKQATYREMLGDVNLDKAGVAELKTFSEKAGLPLVDDKGKDLTKPQLLKALKEAVAGDKENE